jgi:hypothetical protein
MTTEIAKPEGEDVGPLNNKRRDPQVMRMNERPCALKSVKEQDA